MARPKSDNRARLLTAAEETTYRLGFANSALADIAQRAKIPLGNVYYYFKTKDQIGTAIVDRRLARFQNLLRELDTLGSPKERLRGYLQVKIRNREQIARSGCPVGTLCSELHKNGGTVAKRSTALFAEALSWMEQQFKALGRPAEARELAVHLLSAAQGVCVLAHTFHDPSLITMESKRLMAWIRSL